MASFMDAVTATASCTCCCCLPRAAATPCLLQGVVYGRNACFTFYGKGRHMTVNGQQQIDYRAETGELLTALEMQMGSCANFSKKSLTRVSGSIPGHA